MSLVPSLRDRQIESIKKVLNLNQPFPTRDATSSVSRPGSSGLNASSLVAGAATGDSFVDAPGEPVWKVLVFDDMGRDVISSVLRVSDLRSMGVTIHMHLAASRYPIPDVPVVYLVEPTSTNLHAITADLKNGLYSPAYINFISSVPRPLLEEFAAETVESGTAEHIAQLYDQYLNFIVTEPDLFTLGMQKACTYWALNSAKIADSEFDQLIDRIVTGLFGVVVTMGVIPIIRCPKGGAAEMVATKLDRKLRDLVVNSKDSGLFPSHARGAAPTTSSRPVLILLDRNVDLTPMLSHSWTYQSLVHDLLEVKLNRVTLETPIDEADASKGTTKKTYDLTAKDFFWAKNAGVPFPQVAEDIDAELTRYKEDTTEIMKKTGSSSIEDLENDNNASVQHLKAAITLLPELRERKATLDMHVNILAALLAGIKERQIDNYFQIEEDVAKQTKVQMLELVKNPGQGSNAMDKLRLFVIWYLSTEQDISKTEWKQFIDVFEALGVDPAPLNYVKRVRATTMMTQLATVNASAALQPSGSTDLFGRFSSLSSRLTDRLKETGVPSNLSANFESLIGGIKNFLPVNRDFTVTKIVESIMDPSSASSSAIAKTENYLYFDPRNAHARGAIPPPSAAFRVPHTPGSLPGSGTPGSRSSSPFGGTSGGGSGSGGPGGAGATATFGQRRQGFSEAIVFSVGGGSMDEYGNLQEWVARTTGGMVGGGSGGAGSGAGGSTGGGLGLGGFGDKGGVSRRVVYGSTEILSSVEFIRDALERLGREMG